MKVVSMVKRLLSIALVGAIVFGVGSVVVKAAGLTYTGKVVTRGDVVKLTPSVEKTNETLTDAKVTLNVAVSQYDSISVYVRNKNNNIVSTESRVFRGTNKGTTVSIPYKEGSGKKGRQFYVEFAMYPGSAGISHSVDCKFVP